MVRIYLGFSLKHQRLVYVSPTLQINVSRLNKSCPHDHLNSNSSTWFWRSCSTQSSESDGGPCVSVQLFCMRVDALHAVHTMATSCLAHVQCFSWNRVLGGSDDICFFQRPQLQSTWKYMHNWARRCRSYSCLRLPSIKFHRIGFDVSSNSGDVWVRFQRDHFRSK